MNQIETLYIGWQHQESRRWFVVGRLTRVRVAQSGDYDYDFSYVGGVNEAREYGFQPFVSFPEIDQVVRSRDLLPFFRNRVMPRSRPDYDSYLMQLALSPPAEDFSILSRSGGLRTTEHGEIELFARPVQGRSGAYEMYFFVRGMRHVDPRQEALATIKPSDQLLCMLDVQNPFNSAAVLLRTADQRPVGFVPDYLCGDLSTLLKGGSEVRVTTEKINDSPTVPPQNRVLCRLEADVPADFSFFSNPKFDPVAGAESLSVAA